VLAYRVIDRICAAFKTIHHAIVTAKIRRLSREATLHTPSQDKWLSPSDVCDIHDPDKDALRFPQRPLILGDKWDS
jgi:hypothetical protein